MGCSASFAKLILFIFNVAFFLFGAASLAVGIWVAVSKDELFKFINLLDSKVAAGSGKDQIDIVSNQSGLIVIAAYVLIGVGCFTLVVGFCGCCGAIKESNCLLYTYAFLIGLVLIIEIAAAILAGVFQNRIRTEASKALFKLQNEFFVSLIDYEKLKASDVKGSDAGKAAVTYLINFVQVSFDCCGALDVGDIGNSSSWLGSNRTWKNNKQMLTPMTCCKLNKTAVSKNTIKSPTFDWSTFDAQLNDPNCPFVLNSMDKHQKTCYTGLIDYIGKYAVPLIGICVGIALIEILGIVLACCLVSALKNDNAYSK